MAFANYVTVSRIFNAWFVLPQSGYTGWGSFFLTLYEVLSCITVVCHVRAVFGNPGSTTLYVPKEAPNDFENPRICKLCGHRWKPPRAHHCRKCHKCILRMDHHCAWIDNCVGIANQKFFILFLSYSAILCGYQLFLLVLCFVFWVVSASPSIQLAPTCLGLVVLLESISFLYMTVDFLSEQMDALESNSTLVESHQHTHGPQKDLWSNVADVFGPYSIFWLLPTKPNFRLDVSEPVFLDKAVADQLRSRQRKLLLQKEPTQFSLPNRLRLRKQNIQSAVVRRVVGGESEFVGHSEAYSELVCGKMNHDDFSSSDSDVGTQGSEEFKNIYIKPWTDIGVELDNDQSRFIRLEDLDESDQSSENTTEDDDQSDFDESFHDRR